MIRRLKSEVMAQLPAKRRQVVRLPKPRPQDWPKIGPPRPAAEESGISALNLVPLNSNPSTQCMVDVDRAGGSPIDGAECEF